jgi:hypothetical protein
MNITQSADSDQRINPSAADGWRFFGRIYCISLANRTDRRERAQAEFDKVGLTPFVNFHIVQRHPTNSEQGIFESHMACLRDGLAHGAETILIFEDDIEFHRFSQGKFANTIRFLRENTDWNFFIFGGWVNSSRKTKFESVLKIKFRCALHAYVVNRRFAERLVAEPWSGIACDDLVRSLAQEHAYAIYPSVAYQSGATTDNDKMISIDRTRRLIGGVRVLQRWNEFATFRFRDLVYGHILFLLAVIGIAYWIFHKH